MERIVVTGGADFIGSCAMRRLVAAGKRVATLDSLTHAGRVESPGKAMDAQGCLGPLRPGLAPHVRPGLAPHVHPGLAPHLRPAWRRTFGLSAMIGHSSNNHGPWIREEASRTAGVRACEDGRSDRCD